MRALLVLVGLTLAASTFAVVILGTGSRATMAQPVPANVMSVDAVSGGDIDASRTVTSTDPFDVDIYIQHGGSESLDYAWYDAVLCFDPAVLDFLPTTDLDRDNIAESWTYTDLGGLRAHIGVLERTNCPGNLSGGNLYGGSAGYDGQTGASGVAATAAFRCVGSGTTALHLVRKAERPISSTTGTSYGATLPTTLADAQITCSPPPTATACPPGVCTPTATPPPAPTPTSTPTPDPSAGPNLMSVDTVSGGAIDVAREVPVGSQFDVDIDIQHGGSSSFDYAGYAASLCFDPQVLDFVPTQDIDGDTTNESWTYTDLGDMFIQIWTREGWTPCPTAFPGTGLYAGALRAAGTSMTDASGAAIVARFACLAPGVTTLHLVTGEEDALWLTETLDKYAATVPTELADATITCLPDTDGDRCGDRQELAKGLNPINPSDFYNVPAAANPDPIPNGAKDTAVTMGDVLAVLRYVGAHDGDGGSPNPNGVAYDTIKGSCPEPFSGDPQQEGLCYDRSPSDEAGTPWRAGPPSGAVNMQDVLAAVAQVGEDCGGTP